MTEKQTRKNVDFAEFIRVAIVEREKFDTKEKAADELGLTLASYGQRLVREKKRYPAVFEGVPQYGSTRIPTEDEALAVLASLRGDTPADEAGEAGEDQEADESSIG